jgi:CHAT domain-containing protein
MDAVHPEQSGIVLSGVDAQGRPRDGLLRTPEIYRLHLPAELVVLSACRTALGPEIRGEGLVGLPHGFLTAGARSVLVSLWEVEDRATAELMRRFYRGLLREQLPPAAALRAAQTALRREPGWDSPYFWAGFVLQGDWQPFRRQP